METLLIHRSLIFNEHYNDNNIGINWSTSSVNSGDFFFVRLCNELKEKNVKLYSGPRLDQQLTFGPPLAKSMMIEYGDRACTIEVVDNVNDAIEHINTYGSGHTDAIVTENGKNILIVIYLNNIMCGFV